MAANLQEPNHSRVQSFGKECIFPAPTLTLVEPFAQVRKQVQMPLEKALQAHPSGAPPPLHLLPTSSAS